MAGRPPKLMEVSKGKIGKAKIAERKANESKLKVSRGHLREPPEWLDSFAKEEFSRIVNAAAEINILDDMDLSILAVYADSYSHYIQSVEILQNEPPVVKKTTATGTYPIVNPWLTAQEKYVKQIMQCSTKLGLATTDRLKLVVPHQEEKPVNKFLAFVK